MASFKNRALALMKHPVIVVLFGVLLGWIIPAPFQIVSQLSTIANDLANAKDLIRAGYR